MYSFGVPTWLKIWECRCCQGEQNKPWQIEIMEISEIEMLWKMKAP